MAESFYTILTNIGKAQIANASALGTKVKFTTLKLGDSGGNYYNPTETQTALVHEVWSGNIGNIIVDTDNSNWIVLETVIPANVGGFMIRECGIADDEGNLLAVGKYPETYKPVVSEGSSKDLRIRTILEVVNTAAVTLKVDPTVTLVTKEDLETVKNSIPQNASDIGAIASSQIGVTGGVAKQDDLINLGDEVNTHKAENETEFSSLNTRINNLNINDIEARNEIMDIKLKLKEQSAIDFINKTGVGFYDTFADNSNIDLETTASYDSENKNVDFPSIEPYTVKATSDYNDVVLINVDKAVEVGDKLNNTNPVLARTTINNSITYDFTTPTSVTNNLYSVSPTASPQILSNGWIVVGVYDSTNAKLILNVNKNDGNGFTQLCYFQIANPCTFAMCSYNTKIYLLGTYTSSNTVAYFASVEVTSVTNTQQTWATIDSSQTAFGAGCSIAVSTSGCLTAVWVSKNSTYSTSFNLRSVKSINGGVTWTKQDGTAGIDQLSTYNSSGTDITNPYVLYDKMDIPVIVCQRAFSSTYNIFEFYWTGSNWNNLAIYDGEGYAQYRPIATLQKYGPNSGRIWMVWYGSDGTETITNIRMSYSDDNGTTWSSMQKLTTGNVYNQKSPTITSDLNGYVYVLWQGISTGSYDRIRQRIWNLTEWSPILDISSNTTNSITVPITYDNYSNFSNPITIWIDTENNRITFYGKWTIGTITYDITLTDPVTVSEGQELTIYPIEKILKMIDETFDTFNNLDLSLYPNKINKITIKGDVDNSTTVITGVTDKTLTAGDKLFMNNVLNEVLNATGNFITNTVTDATVLDGAYDTSGNGGRKLVRLSNGYLISVVKNGTTSFIIYKSVDNGITWSSIYTAPSTNTIDISIETNGTDIYIYFSHTNNGYYSLDFHRINESGTLLQSATVDNLDTHSAGNCTMAINTTKTELHVAHSCKNATCLYSYNIRYCKGTINLDGSVTWGSVEQVTGADTSGADCLEPTIILDGLDKPHIYMSWTGNSDRCIIELTTAYTTREWTTTASGWGNKYIETYNTYIQSSPCAIFVPQSINGLANGRIWVAWHGCDSTDTTYENIRISYSDDGGLTWSPIQKLTTGNSYRNYYASITADKHNNIYIIFIGTESDSGGYLRLKQAKYNGVTWILSTLTTNNTGQKYYPSTLFDLSFGLDFSEPLFIYQDNVNSKVGFYGTWTVGEGYTLTMQNPVTLTDGDKVPIVDFSTKQGDVDLELDSIDTEKFVFKGSNLNTDNASIKVLGKDNKLNAIAYAVA